MCVHYDSKFGTCDLPVIYTLRFSVTSGPVTCGVTWRSREVDRTTKDAAGSELKRLQLFTEVPFDYFRYFSNELNDWEPSQPDCVTRNLLLCSLCCGWSVLAPPDRNDILVNRERWVCFWQIRFLHGSGLATMWYFNTAKVKRCARFKRVHILYLVIGWHCSRMERC